MRRILECKCRPVHRPVPRKFYLHLRIYEARQTRVVSGVAMRCVLCRGSGSKCNSITTILPTICRGSPREWEMGEKFSNLRIYELPSCLVLPLLPARTVIRNNEMQSTVEGALTDVLCLPDEIRKTKCRAAIDPTCFLFLVLLLGGQNRESSNSSQISGSSCRKILASKPKYELSIRKEYFFVLLVAQCDKIHDVMA